MELPPRRGRAAHDGRGDRRPGRGQFYDATGCIRDVLQNHLLQVVACLAMDPPPGGDFSVVREERVRLLRSIVPLDPPHVVRGQYRGYRDEPGVAKGSQTETFCAVRLRIDSWRWAGVPFCIRAGKRLPTTETEVFAELRRPPRAVFEDVTAGDPDHVRVRINPDPELALGVRVKAPGEHMAGIATELLVTSHFDEAMTPYERLLGDALAGDPTLFASQSEVDAQWAVVDGILDQATPLHVYEPGTWGLLRPTRSSPISAGGAGPRRCRASPGGPRDGDPPAAHRGGQRVAHARRPPDRSLGAGGGTAPRRRHRAGDHRLSAAARASRR